MESVAAVSSASERPSANAPHYVLCAGVLVDADTFELLSKITLVEGPESGINLDELAADARLLVESVASTLTTRTAIERTIQLFLEQRLIARGFRHSEVLVRALVPAQ